MDYGCRGPYLIVLTDRGQTLRFYKADRVRVTPELLRELLTEELWRNTAPWKTNFAPGGKRYILYISFSSFSINTDSAAANSGNGSCTTTLSA